MGPSLVVRVYNASWVKRICPVVSTVTVGYGDCEGGCRFGLHRDLIFLWWKLWLRITIQGPSKPEKSPNEKCSRRSLNSGGGKHLEVGRSPCKNPPVFLPYYSRKWNLLWGEGPKLMLLIICPGESEEREYSVLRLSSLKAYILRMTLWGLRESKYVSNCPVGASESRLPASLIRSLPTMENPATASGTSV